jgi:hypothetical protein
MDEYGIYYVLNVAFVMPDIANRKKNLFPQKCVKTSQTTKRIVLMHAAVFVITVATSHAAKLRRTLALRTPITREHCFTGFFQIV